VKRRAPRRVVPAGLAAVAALATGLFDAPGSAHAQDESFGDPGPPSSADTPPWWRDPRPGCPDPGGEATELIALRIAPLDWHVSEVTLDGVDLGPGERVWIPPGSVPIRVGNRRGSIPVHLVAMPGTEALDFDPRPFWPGSLELRGLPALAELVLTVSREDTEQRQQTIRVRPPASSVDARTGLRVVPDMVVEPLLPGRVDGLLMHPALGEARFSVEKLPPDGEQTVTITAANFSKYPEYGQKWKVWRRDRRVADGLLAGGVLASGLATVAGLFSGIAWKEAERAGDQARALAADATVGVAGGSLTAGYLADLQVRYQDALDWEARALAWGRGLRAGAVGSVALGFALTAFWVEGRVRVGRWDPDTGTTAPLIPPKQKRRR
jgi:hypothetical protein